MKVRVLGAAAGGGLPQWNCACVNCELARAGSPRVAPRTEDSLAVSADGAAWFVLNASPSIHAQLRSFPPLAPRRGRGTPIAGIVLTNGDLDHCLGLFSLRESTPLVVHATSAVFDGLFATNTIARTLQRFDGQLTHRRLELGVETPLSLPSGEPSGLSVVARAAAGKLPVHLMGAREASPEDNVALFVRDDATRGVLAYATSAASLEGLRPLLDEATVVLFDGTFYREDELVALDLGTARARDMAHLPIAGDGGSLAALADLRAPRKVFMHINNTNPILDSASDARAAVTRAGWEVAFDGMDLSL